MRNILELTVLFDCQIPPRMSSDAEGARRATSARADPSEDYGVIILSKIES